VAELLIRGGRVICPAQKIDKQADVLIRDGRIVGIGTFAEAADTIDAAGMIVAPGLIDMHVHLREPGKEEEETIASGSAAAVAGGFTTVAAMPNTDPAVDNEAAVAFQLRQGERAALARVLPVGAVSVGRGGERLAEIGQMSRGGAVAFSDDGDCVRNARLMRAALQYASMFDKPIVDHCEDPDLSGKGVMHAGYWSAKLGLSGMPAAAEEIIVARDLTLAEATGGRLHVAHVSTAGSVDLIRRAKQRGVPVTCEATTHHLTLTDEWVQSFDPNSKMNPPLRSAADLEALRAAIADGTIDCIVSDHAPHAPEEKDVEFTHAPFGVIGLESTLPVLITQLIEPGVLTWPQAIATMTCRPARALGIQAGTLETGRPADATIIDPSTPWTIDSARFRSNSRNCPFHGWKVRGRALVAIVGGEIKHDAREKRGA
jgi:dihydroorotase